MADESFWKLLYENSHPTVARPVNYGPWLPQAFTNPNNFLEILRGPEDLTPYNESHIYFNKYIGEVEGVCQACWTITDFRCPLSNDVVSQIKYRLKPFDFTELPYATLANRHSKRGKPMEMYLEKYVHQLAVQKHGGSDALAALQD
ncbi:hypothetical protein HK097_000068 [Rhizophlyctis rosea]|uniref:Uncharacterized protein n=1 Tax=Rhizophlyctis rosea TaxID=64517 RepID=A0AAD5X564_9FUNG|nr:hypothetical protein HK097_000068 [Rhizophlyctis rosea]